MKSNTYIPTLFCLLLIMILPQLSFAQDLLPVLGSELPGSDVLPGIGTDVLPELPGMSETSLPGLPETPGLPNLQQIIESVPNPPGGGDVNDVPIDGGLSVLLAAGAGYGLKRMQRKK